MSTDSDGPNQGGAGRREVAYRLFATEFDDSTVSHSDSDEERAPNYVITPTGARVNRLFVVGVLTEVESVSDDVLRARVVDPTGAFVIYAGQYQPDPMTFLERADPPAFVAVTGKARTYQPEDSDRIFTSIRPESINEVDSDTRDRWTVQAAEQTIERIETFLASRDRPEAGPELERALIADGVDAGLAAGIPLAMDHYGTTDAYLAALREIAVDAVRVVANEREEVPPLELAPDEGGAGSVEIETGTVDTGDRVSTEPTSATDTGTASDSEPASTSGPTTADSATQSSTPGEADGDSEPESEPEPEPSTTATESTAPAEPTADVSGGGTTEPTETMDSTGSDDLGDFDDFNDSDTGSDVEPDTAAGSTAETDAEADLDVASDEMYEFDEEEREEIEAEYGTEFSTGTEVDEPGAADIETPEPAADESEPKVATETVAEASPETIEAEEATTDAGDDTDETTETTDTQSTESQPAEPDLEPEDEDEAADESEAESETGQEPSTETDEEAEQATAVDLDEAVIEVMDELDDGDGADREMLIETMTDRHGVDANAVEDAIQDALMSGQCYEPDEGRLKAI
ncbi:MAG: hypothetical protein SVG88_11950 [Halobacteriales archaeon]|nr:hypothetical protein [Halobacteriales archaeon]